MTSGLAAFIFAVGIAAWVYNKIAQRTGNNTKTSLIVAAVVGLVAFVVFFSVLKLFIK